MIKRYSSRKAPLVQSLLSEKLKNAKSYDRIAGYFRSSIFEVAGEALDSVTGKIRVICNSDLCIEDVKTAQLAQQSMKKEWWEGKPEEWQPNKKRFEQLYDYLVSEKIEVRVLPNECFGLIHGKAGVITLENGKQTTFLGSINESFTAWKMNYELAWEDDSIEAITWVQEEFDALWNHPYAVPLAKAVIEDIKRLANRCVIDDIEAWRAVAVNHPATVAVESPVYREQFGLWDHQKYFVEVTFRDHKKDYGARYILADQVGLGKTIQLAMSAQLMALHGDKPILIIAPKTLLWQWQEELWQLLELPTAVWNGHYWVDEQGIRYLEYAIGKCPRRIGIISQGLITSDSQIIKPLLAKEYECVIVDEAHRARRKNLGASKENQKPEMNNLYEYLVALSKKTHSMLLATATPIQMYPVELWDLLNILSQKNDSVLGSLSSYWRKDRKVNEGLALAMGKMALANDEWEWMRNPFPPSSEHPKFEVVRRSLGLKDNQFVISKARADLTLVEKLQITSLMQMDYFKQFNPYIRHVVRRERIYLENSINEATGKPYLQKIHVNLHGEGEDGALILTGYMKEAYELAEAFCDLLGKRVKGATFLKTLLLKRLGSSIEAGRKTGYRMLHEWGTGGDLSQEEEEDAEKVDEDDIKNLTKEEKALLARFVAALESNEAVDPKYEKVVELLLNQQWLEKGTIIFTQYYDTAKWVAEKLSKTLQDEVIALYAGGIHSGIYKEGRFERRTKEDIKQGIKKRAYRLMIGTDAASEGLNLQTLGTLINLDLPWNPTRLEQRKGRIQRIGQINDTVELFNMRYKESVEDRVHDLLSERLKSITDLFGQLPDILEDVWIKVATNQIEEAEKMIYYVPEVHPFESRYNNYVKSSDWESCHIVLNKHEKLRYLEEGWK